MNNLPEIITSIETALEFLSRNHASMPHDLFRRQRDEAIVLGTAILNDADLDITHADWMRVYDAVIELDRIGY